MSALPPYSVELAAGDPTSPQAKALEWLSNDPQFSEYEMHRLYQRYALAVLYYSTTSRLWDSEGWMTYTNECTWNSDWRGYVGEGSDNEDMCGEESQFLYLNLGPDPLAGTIPSELELMSDLVRLQLGGDSGSLWIPGRAILYVA
jgi:hypothetical protein